jgi:ATP-dependent Clp protease ATP-binding subunit ClpC
LNRIDEIVLFRKLEKPQLRSIVSLLLDQSASRLARREISFEATDAVVDWLAEHGYEPEYGARPLRRLIQREVDDRIADLLVSGELTDEGAVRIDVVDDRPVATAVSRRAVAA